MSTPTSAPTNDWDLVVGLNQDCLTNMVANLYSAGKFPNHFGPKAVQTYTVEFDMSEPTIAFAANPSDGDCTFSGDPQPIAVTIPITNGTLTGTVGQPKPLAGPLTVTMNMAAVAISTISQPNYLQCAGGQAAPANCGSVDPFTGDGCTLEAWIQSTATTPQTVLLFGSASPALAVFQGANDDDQLRLYWGDDYYDGDDAAKAPILDGLWHHIAVTVAADTINFYKDGQLKKAIVISAQQWSSSGDLQLGAADAAAGLSAFNGNLAQVRVWNYVRSTEQIQQSMNVHLDNEPGLIGYWTFDDDSVTNQVNGKDGSVGAGGQVVNLKAEEISYALNLYFLDPANVFCVSANVSTSDTTNTSFATSIQNYLDELVTPMPLHLGTFTPTVDKDGNVQPVNNEVLPTYLITTLLAGQSGALADQELVLMAMMQNSPQPAGDPNSEFIGDPQVALPPGSNLLVALWDYYLFDGLVTPALADKFGVSDSYFSVSQDPVKLSLSKDIDYKGATISELTMQLNDQGFYVQVEAVKGPTVLQVSATIGIAIQDDGSGSQELVFKLIDPSIAISANLADPKVDATIAAALLVASLLGPIGYLLIQLALLVLLILVEVFESIILKKIQSNLGDKSKSPDLGTIEITNLVFDQGIQIYMDFKAPESAQSGSQAASSRTALPSAPEAVSAAAGPVITSFSPPQGNADTSVTIWGSGFTAASAVKFNAVNAPYFRVKSDEQIIAQPGSAATSGAISVTTPFGTAVSATPFTVIAQPVITNVSTANELSLAGDSLTIDGNNFTQSPAISIGDSKVPAASLSVNSDGTQIVATIAPGSISGPVYVVTTGGQAVSEQTVEIGSTQSPVVQSFSPGEGAPDISVTIRGANFAGTTQVSFNGVPAYPFTVVSDAQIVAYVPQLASSGPLTVTNNQGASPPNGDFIVTPAPAITSVAPLQGGLGQPVTITGENFSGATLVTFGTNTIAAAFTVQSDTQITASVPSGAVDGPIRVTTPGGTAITKDAPFTVQSSAPPANLSFAPASGPYATEVTISGVNFTGTTSVTFNGTPATPYTVMSDTEIVAYVPTAAASGPIEVTNNTNPPSGPTRTSQSFMVYPAPVIDSVNHSGDPAGNPITIRGQNFDGTTLVTVGANRIAAEPFTVGHDDKGYWINTTVPLGAVSGPISVTTPGGTAVSSTSFSVYSSAGPADITFSPAAAPVGASVTINGKNFTGALGVTFSNGVKANSWQVASDTEMTARVPQGATTGKISVTNTVDSGSSTADFTVGTASASKAKSPLATGKAG